MARKHRSALGGRFTYEDLEVLLNDEGREGWVLDRIIDPAVTEIMEDGRPVHLIVFRRRVE